MQELLAWAADPVTDAPRRVLKRRHARAKANAKRIRKKLEARVGELVSVININPADNPLEAHNAKRLRRKLEKCAGDFVSTLSSNAKEGRRRARKRARKLAADYVF